MREAGRKRAVQIEAKVIHGKESSKMLMALACVQLWLMQSLAWAEE